MIIVAVFGLLLGVYEIDPLVSVAVVLCVVILRAFFVTSPLQWCGGSRRRCQVVADVQMAAPAENQGTE